MAKRASDEVTMRLEDTNLVKLSQRLTDVAILETLAYRGLTLEHHEIESAIKNHPGKIQEAAYKIMSTWVSAQEDRVQAYINLKTALQECGLAFLMQVLEESQVNTTASSCPLRSLLDSDVQRLSERFTDVGVLKQLGYRGLKMESHEIQSAISNHPSDIQAAAHDVLRKWQLAQGNREKALRSLLTALEESNLKSFAEELKKWKMKSNSSLSLSEERKSFILLLFNVY